jgi:hypothetical protein
MPAKFLAIAALAAAGCTFEWSSNTPSFPLEGEPPALSSFQKLNLMPAGRAARMTGPDGATWTAFCEFSVGSGSRNCLRMHLVRLGAPGEAPAEEIVTSSEGFAVHDHELYEMHDDKDAMTRTITLHRPGDAPSSDVAFTVPIGRALLYANDNGASDVFAYWVLDPATTSYDVYRRDQAFHRKLPLPVGVDPTQPDAQNSFDFVLSSDGNTLVERQPDGTTTAYSTRDASQVALGTRPHDFFIDNKRGALVTIGDDGFRAVPLAGGPDVVLDPIGFDPPTLALRPAPFFRDRTLSQWPLPSTQFDFAFYARADGVWQVPLDGSAPPSLIQPGAARLIQLGPRGEVIYSHDPPSRYAGGAGDGWLGDRQLVERGRLGVFSGDGARYRFLEHAATLGTYGDLTSVGVAGGASITLGINVHFYDELPDGRVLAIENFVYSGNWNRLVVIDEVAGSKHWVVPSTSEFFLIPGGRELIANVVDGQGFDILRVPAPQ